MENLSLKAGECFDEVMRTYTPTVYRIAFARLGNRTDAEDVVQEVFVRYFKANKDFESEEHRKHFLVRCAVNCTNSFAGSAWYRHKAHSDGLENFAEDDLQLPDTTAGSAERSETRREILGAVMKLAPKYRTVIHLFYFEDLPIAQIADITGEKESTVKSQLSRARDKLRVILKDYDFE